MASDKREDKKTLQERILDAIEQGDDENNNDNDDGASRENAIEQPFIMFGVDLGTQLIWNKKDDEFPIDQLSVWGFNPNIIAEEIFPSEFIQLCRRANEVYKQARLRGVSQMESFVRIDLATGGIEFHYDQLNEYEDAKSLPDLKLDRDLINWHKLFVK
jgi:hypothetical protein